MSTKYPSFHLEGGFLATEIIDDIAEGKAAGQRPRDFGIADQTHLIDQISAAWSDARGFWQSFWRRAEKPQEGETGVTFTRAQWAIPLFSVLGYDLTLQERAAEVEGLTFAVSHRADAVPGSPPVHVVGAWQSLDRRAESGRPRLAPHSLVQEYLNRTEFLWGIATNGRALRLLRNSQLIRRQAYIEFNLETMFNGEHFADFALYFRLLHRSRLPHKDETPEKCLLEQWYRQTIEQGGRVREHLREGVENAIPLLANAILRHPRNADLRQAVASGELKAQTLYEEILRLVYRLLFLMVTEERNLLTSNAIYRERYSISRLRRLCENHLARNQHIDLWTGLQSTCRLFHTEDLGRVLDVPPLNGDLFNLNLTPHLNSATIANADFLNALWSLAMYREDRHSAPRRINYSALDVEELGSVYESLLDLQPVFTQEDGRAVFSLIKGTQRKTTGSYYTHPELVDELVQSALVTVIQDRLRDAHTSNDKQKALLGITICDPASGSGHFLLAAARRLARELAQIRSGEEEPSPREYRIALRDVISHCIYGVDRNPLAVELGKVALWLESHAEGKPLSFLDHRIVCGNSLVGVRDLAVLKRLLPDDAFKPVTGDDKEVAKKIKARNRHESAASFDFSPVRDVSDLTAARKELFDLPDDTPEQVQRKKAVLEQARASRKYMADRQAADLWCTAFFAELTEKNLRDNVIPTTAAVLNALEQRPPYGPMAGLTGAIDCRVRFFHWPLEFPEVFSRGGFDVVLCNPPWERIKLQQEEFFSTRDLAISRAPNKAAREQLIRELPHTSPSLWREWSLALHDADSLSRFLRASALYPLTARGDINTYSVFAERFTRLIRPQGGFGAVLPTGIATDDTNKLFFAEIATTGHLASLYDFENREGLFPGVHRSYKFSLVTFCGAEGRTNEPANFAFFLGRAQDLHDPRRTFALMPDDFVRLNPNTKTCPVFRTRADAELTRKIYERVPVLVNETNGESAWGIKFLAMFHMANDSHLFRRREWLEERGFQLSGNRFVNGNDLYLPLYEAKMIHQYDHRPGTFERVMEHLPVPLPPLPAEKKVDPMCVVLPWYWVNEEQVRAVLPGFSYRWFIGFRDVARSTDVRTATFSLVPWSAVNHKLPLVLLDSGRLAGLFLSACNSLCSDYLVRQKIGGASLSFFVLKQIPIPPPESYAPSDAGFILPRVAELACTAWDIQPFLDDVWREADNPLRMAIKRQGCENREVTGGHTYDPPEWYSPPEDRCPLPPFKWDEDRRAQLRAEIDACYAKLYGLHERDLRHILDPTDVYGPDFPGETFRVLKEKEIARFGEYRTRRLVLDAYEKLSESSRIRNEMSERVAASEVPHKATGADGGPD